MAIDDALPAEGACNCGRPRSSDPRRKGGRLRPLHHSHAGEVPARVHVTGADLLMDSYNVAPTQQVPIVACLSASARLLWCVGGLSHFSPKASRGVQHINARLEPSRPPPLTVDRGGAASAAYSWRALLRMARR